MTMLTFFSLPKVILIPSEILHFDWSRVYKSKKRIHYAQAGNLRDNENYYCLDNSI